MEYLGGGRGAHGLCSVRRRFGGGARRPESAWPATATSGADGEGQAAQSGPTLDGYAAAGQRGGRDRVQGGSTNGGSEQEGSISRGLFAEISEQPLSSGDVPVFGVRLFRYATGAQNAGSRRERDRD